MRSLPSNKEKILKGIQDLSPAVAEERNKIFSNLHKSTFKKLPPKLSSMYTLDYDETNDLVASTYEKAYQQIMLGKYEEKGFGLAWIMTIARNMFINDHRRSVSSKRVSNYDNPDAQYSGVCEENPHTLLVTKEFFQQINEEMGLMSSNHREVILGRLDQKSYSKLASEQHAPEGTVKIRIHNAKRKLLKNPHINEMYHEIFKSA